MSSENQLAVMGAALAAVLAVIVSEGAFDIWDSIAGLTLIMFVFAYGGFRRGLIYGEDAFFSKLMAFSAVIGICILLILGFLVERIQPEDGIRKDLIFFGLWVFSTIVVAGVRMLFIRRAATPNRA
jgi:hypothetical protein